MAKTLKYHVYDPPQECRTIAVAPSQNFNPGINGWMLCNSPETALSLKFFFCSAFECKYTDPQSYPNKLDSCRTGYYANGPMLICNSYITTFRWQTDIILLDNTLKTISIPLPTGCIPKITECSYDLSSGSIYRLIYRTCVCANNIYITAYEMPYIIDSSFLIPPIKVAELNTSINEVVYRVYTSAGFGSQWSVILDLGAQYVRQVKCSKDNKPPCVIYPQVQLNFAIYDTCSLSTTPVVVGASCFNHVPATYYLYTNTKITNNAWTTNTYPNHLPSVQCGIYTISALLDPVGISTISYKSETTLISHYNFDQEYDVISIEFPCSEAFPSLCSTVRLIIDTNIIDLYNTLLLSTIKVYSAAKILNFEQSILRTNNILDAFKVLAQSFSNTQPNPTCDTANINMCKDYYIYYLISKYLTLRNVNNFVSKLESFGSTIWIDYNEGNTNSISGIYQGVDSTYIALFLAGKSINTNIQACLLVTGLLGYTEPVNQDNVDCQDSWTSTNELSSSCAHSGSGLLGCSYCDVDGKDGCYLPYKVLTITPQVITSIYVRVPTLGNADQEFRKGLIKLLTYKAPIDSTSLNPYNILYGGKDQTDKVFSLLQNMYTNIQMIKQGTLPWQILGGGLESGSNYLDIVCKKRSTAASTTRGKTNPIITTICLKTVLIGLSGFPDITNIQPTDISLSSWMLTLFHELTHAVLSTQDDSTLFPDQPIYGIAQCCRYSKILEKLNPEPAPPAIADCIAMTALLAFLKMKPPICPSNTEHLLEKIEKHKFKIQDEELMPNFSNHTSCSINILINETGIYAQYSFRHSYDTPLVVPTSATLARGIPPGVLEITGGSFMWECHTLPFAVTNEMTIIPGVAITTVFDLKRVCGFNWPHIQPGIYLITANSIHHLHREGGASLAECNNVELCPISHLYCSAQIIVGESSSMIESSNSEVMGA